MLILIELNIYNYLMASTGQEDILYVSFNQDQGCIACGT